MLKKSRHYAAQAAIQARLEMFCRQEEARLKGEPHDFGYVADLGPEESESHAELRRLYERLASHPWETPPADLPMPFPWDRDRDLQVIEAALDDVTDPRNPESAIGYPANSGLGSEVVLGEMTYPDDSKDREPLVEGQGQNAEDEARSDLIRRNRGGGLPLDELGQGWRRPIRLDDLERLFERGIEAGEPFWDYFHQCHPKACTWLEVSMPGYSRDGRTSIVRFVRSSYHCAFWTYVLEKTGMAWKVVRRKHEATE
jgi:hypothetical protein